MTDRILPAALALLMLLAACGAPDTAPRNPKLGDFRLGYLFIRADAPEQGPFSRDATPTQLTTALEQAIETRLGRYDGEGLYHLGIAIGGYVLAQPGLPVIYTPKSVLIFEVTAFDNSTQSKLNDEPFRITAFEGLQNTAPVIGSGLARDGDAQLANLAAEGARQLESWLAKHPDWFVPDPETPRTPFDRTAEKARLTAARAGQPVPAATVPAAPRTEVAAPAAMPGLVQPGVVAAVVAGLRG
jgi:hypothetical protein